MLLGLAGVVSANPSKSIATNEMLRAEFRLRALVKAVYKRKNNDCSYYQKLS